MFLELHNDISELPLMFTSWFSSYLNKRFQQTHYGGAISDKKEACPKDLSLGQFSS